MKLSVFGFSVLLAGCAAIPADRSPTGHEEQEMIALSLDSVDGWREDGEWLVSPVLDAPEGASRVGLLLVLESPGGMPVVEARVISSPAGESTWTSVPSSFSEEDHHVGYADLDRTGYAAEIRLPRAAVDGVAHLRWTAVIPDERDEAAAPEGDLGAAREPLIAELRGLDIVTREDWGARATRCRNRNADKTKMAIHYTVTPSDNPERQVRSIQRYHMDSRGWCDVGYHFLVGVDGSIYEGRPIELLGAHVSRNNTGNIGVAFVGCFHGSGCSRWGPQRPPTAMIDAGGRLLGRLSRVYDITLNESRVKGHRDHPGASTSCPGDHLRVRISDMLAIGRRGDPPISDPPTMPADPPAATDPPPAGASGPPAGLSCTHSFGGVYANTACSPGYQCCDGRWHTRPACGACFCVEETGTAGCGAGGAGTPAPLGSINAGLSQGGSEIPRAGLTNETLRGVVGFSTEPRGDVVSVDGEAWVRGRLSWFGGPDDRGVSSTETGAITFERLRSLNDPTRPSSATLSSRPEDYYFVAMRWNYSPNGRTFWRDARLVVKNPDSGAAVVVRPVDWGPHTRTNRIIDLSPQSLVDLSVATDDDVLVAFAPAGTPLGPVR